MPRPNPPRELGSETNVARRVADERNRRDWSYETLARRMTAAGCPIQASAIYKIEKGDPPRRISVDELVAFAAALEVDVKDLLISPEGAAMRESVALAGALRLALSRLPAEDKDRVLRFVSVLLEGSREDVGIEKFLAEAERAGE